MVYLKSIVLTEKKPEVKDHMCHSKNTKLFIQKIDQWLPGMVREGVLITKGHEGTFGEDGNIFVYLDCGGVSMTVYIVKIHIIVHPKG